MAGLLHDGTEDRDGMVTRDRSADLGEDEEDFHFCSNCSGRLGYRLSYSSRTNSSRKVWAVSLPSEINSAIPSRIPSKRDRRSQMIPFSADQEPKTRFASRCGSPEVAIPPPPPPPPRPQPPPRGPRARQPMPPVPEKSVFHDRYP